MTEPLRANANVRGILLDIEGTTTPISFVHEVLFPYARAAIRNFLIAHWRATEVNLDVALLREEHATETGAPPLIEGPANSQIESITEYIHWLIDQDRKSTGLKSLQGKIWKQGYLDGTLKAPVFEDVPPALERWRRAAISVAIFSSGSVLAQQLLFAHTDAGDLSGLIDAYFDTTVGSKLASDSYQKIAAALRLPAPEILFISDVVNELDAANVADMRTLLIVRPGNPPQPSGKHEVTHSFDNVPEMIT